MLHPRPAKTQGEVMLHLVGGPQRLADVLRDDRRRLAELVRLPKSQIQFDNVSEVVPEDPERWDGLS